MLIFDGDALNATVGNLSKYTEHAIMGAAVNSKGQSNFTSATIIRTNEDGKHVRLNTYRKSSSKPGMVYLSTESSDLFWLHDF